MLESNDRPSMQQYSISKPMLESNDRPSMQQYSISKPMLESNDRPSIINSVIPLPEVKVINNKCKTKIIYIFTEANDTMRPNL